MSKLVASTCSAMLKINQLYVMDSYLIKSLRILQRIRKPVPYETSRNLSDGGENLSQSSTDAKNCIQMTRNGRKKKNRAEDDRFHALIESIRIRTARDKLGLTYICGSALIKEAIGKGVLLQEIYFHNSDDLLALPHPSLISTGVQFVPVSKESFARCHLNAELSTDRLLAVFAIPVRQRLSKNRSSDPALPVTVICDNIRDPGNMAKIIQSSVAVSCERILVTKGCVDVWEPKVLQMGRGAHFDTFIEMNLDWNEIGECLPTDCSIYLADSCSSPQQRHHDIEEEGRDVVSGGRRNDRQTAEDDANGDDHRRHVCSEYDAIDYCSSHHAVVVIGGETKGISRQAYFHVFSRTGERQGHRIHVPMMSGIDSLNSAVAGSIILFEIGRQMRIRSRSCEIRDLHAT